MISLGLFVTECVVRCQKHTLEFEIVETSQQPVLVGATCESLRLINFTITAHLNTIDKSPGWAPEQGDSPKQIPWSLQLTGRVSSREVHFELDAAIQPVQCTPRNVPVAIKAAAKAQLDKSKKIHPSQLSLSLQPG